MAPTIEAFKVYDPAYEDGNVDEPVRVHIGLNNFPDEPTYVDLDLGPFTVSHYGKYMKIFSDLPEWDDEDSQACAARFNNHFSTSEWEPVIPITVLRASGDSALREVDRALPLSAEDFFVKVSTMKKLLDYYNEYGGNNPDFFQQSMRWTVQPRFTSAANKRHTWEVRDLNDLCYKCGHQGTQVNFRERGLPLCDTHHREHTAQLADAARAARG